MSTIQNQEIENGAAFGCTSGPDAKTREFYSLVDLMTEAEKSDFLNYIRLSMNLG